MHVSPVTGSQAEHMAAADGSGIRQRGVAAAAQHGKLMAPPPGMQRADTTAVTAVLVTVVVMVAVEYATLHTVKKFLPLGSAASSPPVSSCEESTLAACRSPRGASGLRFLKTRRALRPAHAVSDKAEMQV